MKLLSSLDREKRRRISILLLVGVIAVLAFSLVALYDFYFSYERSTDDIPYMRVYYVEFYSWDNTTDFVAGAPFNVTFGVSNYLGEDKDFVVEWGIEENVTLGVREVSVQNQRTVFVDVEITVHEETLVYFVLKDDDGTEHSRIRRLFFHGA